MYGRRYGRGPVAGLKSWAMLWWFCIAAVLYFGWPWLVPEPAGTVIGIIWVPFALLLWGRLRGKHKAGFSRRRMVTGTAPPPRRPLPPATRQFVWNRDGGRCRSCRIDDASCMSLYGQHLQFDHVIPRYHGGTDDPANLQLLCPPENRAKGASLTWRPRSAR